MPLKGERFGNWPLSDQVHGDVGISEKTDAELLQAVAARRDQDAFTEFFKRHSPAAYSLAKKVTCDSELASDVVQDAMLMVWRDARLFRPGNARTWTLSIVAHSAYNMVRKQKRLARGQDACRERQRMEPRARSGHLGDATALLQPADTGPALSQALEALPVETRALVALYFGANCSQAEIGRRMGVSQRTVSERLRSVVKVLKDELTRRGFAHGEVALQPALESLFASPEPVPAGLREAVRMRIAAAPRSDACSTPLWGAVALLALAAGTATGVIFTARVGAPFSKPTRNPVSVPAQVAMADSLPRRDPGLQDAGRKRFLRSWDFNAPDFMGIRVTGGSWRWQASGGVEDSGCMAIENSFLLAEVDVPARPVRVTVRYRVRVEDLKQAGSGDLLSVVGKNYFWAGLVRNAAEPTIVPRRGMFWFSLSYVVTSCWIQSFVDGKLTKPLVGDTVRERGFYLKSFIGGWIDDLRVEELFPEELPEASPIVQAVLAIPPGKRTGQVALPQFKSPIPGKRVLVDFVIAP